MSRFMTDRLLLSEFKNANYVVDVVRIVNFIYAMWEISTSRKYEMCSP